MICEVLTVREVEEFLVLLRVTRQDVSCVLSHLFILSGSVCITVWSIKSSLKDRHHHKQQQAACQSSLTPGQIERNISDLNVRSWVDKAAEGDWGLRKAVNRLGLFERLFEHTLRLNLLLFSVNTFSCRSSSLWTPPRGSRQSRHCRTPISWRTLSPPRSENIEIAPLLSRIRP